MPKIVYLVTEDWFACSHFLPMFRQARADGFEVVVVTRIRAHEARLIAEGCRVVPLEAERRSLSPVEIVRGWFRLLAILRRERPQIVHCIALRMVVLGGLAARLSGVRRLVLAPTGLGHLWIANGIKERLARSVSRFVVGRVLRGAGTLYLFENMEDPREFGLDPASDEVVRVGGAGVDPEQFATSPEPPCPPVKIAIVARMTRQKGIPESIAAVERARALGADVELDLIGAPDTSNRAALAPADIEDLSKDPAVRWRGPSSDISAVWREHHIAMLLSHREGMPRSLIEAAMCARPIIATDVTGCRDVVRHGVDGILVPPGDIQSAAEAIVRLAGDAGLRRRMGAAAAERARQEFSEDAVRRTVGAVYARLMRS